MMTKGNRLRGLQMRKTGHDGGVFARCQFHHAALQARQLAANRINFIAQIQTHIGGDLIVARAAGVQFFTGDADGIGQTRFDVHVHIFQCNRPREIARFNLRQNIAQTLLNGAVISITQNTGAVQHLCVRE